MMVHHIFEAEGTTFPAGRCTRVIVGPNAPAEAKSFVMGHVTVFAGGSVPEHVHEQEEVYFILEGQGVMAVDGEEQPVQSGSYVYIRPNQTHFLRNTAESELKMLFCYAPKSIVDHWQQELSGTLPPAGKD
ncbi:MAG: dimethylsulfonioproprionate lyase family protein [Negativicutes bacterium]|nr:dimethylsulfonioproprionate lyase family protein [Negativicutes bacterium]